MVEPRRGCIRRWATRIALLACVYAASAHAAAVQLPLTIYDQSNGLGSLSVVRLQEDREGVLWAGTEKGLYRFDGVGFEAVGASRGFQTSEVVALAEDAGGHLWVASRAGTQRRKEDGNFEWVRPGGKTLLVDRGQSLAADDHGGVIAVSSHRLLRLGADASGAWTSLPIAGLPDAGPADVSAVLHHGGTTWFGCGAALCRLRNGVLVSFGTDKGVPADKWLGLLVSRDGSLWARGMGHVLRLPAGASAFITLDIPGGHMQVAASSIDLAEDRAGRILTRTDIGVARFDGARWQLFDTGNGLPGVGVSSMVADRDGMVWMGTYGRGVYYWSSADAVEDWTAAQGLSGRLVWSIARSDSRSVWMASEAGGEVLLPDKGEAGPAPLALPPPYQAHAVIADGNGGIWYFLFDGRVVRYDEKAGRTVQVVTLPHLIRGALMDHRGRLWVYTLGGLFEVDPVHGTAMRASDGLIPPSMCSDAAEDDKGRLWFACSAGLFRLSGDRWSRVHVQPDESAGGYENVAVTPDGRLWLSSLQPGLWEARASDDDTLTAAPVNDALLADTRFYFLRVDHRGRLWAGGGSGVDVLDQDQRWTRLSMRDGLLWDETNHGAFLADRDGTVWIGAPVGLTHVLDPDQLLAPRHLLPLLADVSYGADDVDAEGTLPFQQAAALVLRFGVAGNGAGHPVRFRYRLSGIDGGWVETQQREIRYPSLPPGHYAFEMQVVDVNRRADSSPVSLAFTVAPPWWRTPWAYAGATLLLLASLWLAWHSRTRILVAHARRLETIVAVRTGELRDALHARRMLLAHVGHDLRAPLGTILGAVRLWRSGDTGRDHPRVIERHVHQQMELIDDLLEFSRGELTGLQLDPVPGYLSGFLHAVAERAELLAERHGNHLAMYLDERLPPLVVADFHRLGQALSNLLGNAAKFTHGGSVGLHVDCVGLERTHACLRFVVRDSGIGMDPASLAALQQPFARADNAARHEGTGLGLAIVEQVLDRMGTRLSVEAVPTGGSCFSFELTLPLAAVDDLEAALPAGENPGDLDGAGRVVLVVEPHAPTRALLCDLLDGYGFHSVPAADGLAAGRAFREQPPALVVTELHFPGGDGWRLLHAIREATPDVPVLLYAAVAPTPGFLGETRFDAVVLKPATAEELLRHVIGLVGGGNVPA